MRFSERMGHKPVRDVIQREGVDAATKNRLWDVVWSCLPEGSERIRMHPDREFYYAIWIGFFEQPADQMPEWNDQVHSSLRLRFHDGSWVDMYDVLEVVVQESAERRPRALDFANEVLEDYLCAYRFVGGELVELTDEQDIASVEAALESPLAGVRAHLSKALSFLGDRENPDVPNSIKESISAVESLCCAIVQKKTTLGDALRKLEANGVAIHKSLTTAWGALYGWTSDEHGVRHAMQDEPGVSTEDAIYMLVSCSAFISLLTEKARKAGIELKPVGQ